jgi:hypothetical protein
MVSLASKRLVRLTQAQTTFCYFYLALSVKRI